MTLPYRIAAFLLLAAAIITIDASAQAQRPQRPFGKVVEEWTRTFDRTTQDLNQADITEEQLAKIRKRLEKIRDDAVRLGAEAHAQSESRKTLLEALGPPPEDAATPEPKDVATQRATLNDDLAFFEGRGKQSDLAVAKATELLHQLAETRRIRFRTWVLERGPTPLSTRVWTIAAPEFVSVLGQIASATADWVASADVVKKLRQSFWVIGAGIVAAFILGWPLRSWLLQRFGRSAAISEPSYLRRVVAAGVEGGVHALLPSLAGAVAYVTLLSQGLLTGTIEVIATAALEALVFFSLSSALIRAALAPNQPAWRVTPFTDQNSSKLSRLLILLAAIFTLDIVLGAVGRKVGISIELEVAYNLVIYSSIAVLVLLLLRQRLWAREAKDDEAPTPPTERLSTLWPALRLVARLSALAIPVSALLGYYVLSRFLALRLVVTGLLIALLVLLHNLTRELVALAMAADSTSGQTIRRVLGIGEQGGRLFQFWLIAALDVLLFLAVMAVALPLWGMGWNDVAEWMKAALFGFTIGDVTISLSELALAALIFVALLAVTRFIQRALEERILPQTRMDIGVRHSIKTAVGYLGLVLAAVIAVSTVGIDLSNLAIIAGALSVGIGFGLQNVVNNFVSGLILLVERPIKAGDWVVVGNNEGYVRRIKVRATEIETFDRAEVIIPNSELISTAVTNWTHRSKIGRVIVAVGVAYGSDTEKVREVLLDCARAHAEVLKSPAPFVVFQNFGASSLDFELRAYIRQVTNRLTVGSDLRFSVDKAFHEAGIEIPFPQQDLHIKDTAALHRILGQENPTGDRLEPDTR